MRKSVILRATQFLSATFLSVYVVVSGALPAFASSEDTAGDVTVMKTEHKWFYWPGWAFVGLAVLVIAVVLFFWIKNLILPKYRGRKVAA